ncbi:HlyD family type I secretion periplasmic adaptor subunit [Brevundimonas fontaquae]|uniref:Membrane fusion protein (MFP) family protein n=1 Tax=Brevundimonas fontaquae TaxID=2813778 RepID=A0ABX7LRN9_9CAUL|nr:HlyD family type I secretion periplasmic adaptor subunit [Brevundimonas fontaquae]QSF54700.1 HlyD family type I secretion periplasmic adaptor subunit [Brevundimonas fontaquae]
MKNIAATSGKVTINSPRGEITVGSVVVGIFFIGFLGWASLAPLDAGAYASGQVTVSGNQQAVQHQEGGIVETLNVGEGDSVRRDQVLITLSSGNVKANERGITGQILALMAQRSRMVAERDGLPTVAAPIEFEQLPTDDLAMANEALRLQRLQFEARSAGRSTQQSVLSQRIEQLNKQIEGYSRQIAANLEQRRLIQEELEGMRTLAEKGYAPQNRVRALERAAASLEGELGSLRAQAARARESIGETQFQRIGVTTQTNEEIAEGLRQIDIQLNDLLPKQIELREQIARSAIRSPASGQVVGLTVFTPGGVIQPAQTLMSIVPDRAEQVIVVSINPNDIDDVKKGMETEIRFPGLHDRSIPIIRGHLTVVSADAFTDQNTGRAHFRGEVTVSSKEMEKVGPLGTQIRNGTPVEVVILLRKRTALEYLLEPLTRSVWRSGSGI